MAPSTKLAVTLDLVMAMGEIGRAVSSDELSSTNQDRPSGIAVRSLLDVIWMDCAKTESFILSCRLSICLEEPIACARE
jgi:hypothetical protein